MANVWGRTHFHVRQKENARWYEFIHFLSVGKRPIKPLTKCKLTLVRVSSSEPDYDGLVLSFKQIVDGLVKSGIIIDDKLSVTGKWNCDWEKGKPKHGLVKIHVESAE